MIDRFLEVWATLALAHDHLIGFAFTLLAALIFYGLRARVSLIFGRASNSFNTIHVSNEENPEKSSSTDIYIEKYFLQNTGKKPATDVEFVLSDFPSDIAVFEPRDVKYINVERGSCLILIPRIAPGELLVINCAHINKNAARVTSVKCAEALGKEVPFWTLRRFPSYIYFGVWVLMFFGAASLVQIAFGLF